MTVPTKPARPRRFGQFSLRSVGVLILVIAVGLVIWEAQVAPYRAQQQAIAFLGDYKAKVLTRPGPGLLARVLGEENVQDVVQVDLRGLEFDAACLEHVSQLPRIEMLLIDSPDFRDKQLLQLRGLKSLRGLVLDSTAVSDPALDELRRDLPDLAVHKTERRTLEAIVAGGGRASWTTRRDGGRHLGPLWLRRAAGDDLVGNITSVWPGSKASDADLKRIAKLEHLDTLDLHNSGITDAGLAHLAGHSRLRSLDLNFSFVSDRGIAHLATLENLQSLMLDCRGVGDAGVARLGQLKNLEALMLNGDNLTGAGLLEVKSLKRLKYLWIKGGRIPKEVVQELRHALPEAQIIPLERPQPRNWKHQTPSRNASG